MVIELRIEIRNLAFFIQGFSYWAGTGSPVTKILIDWPSLKLPQPTYSGVPPHISVSPHFALCQIGMIHKLFE